MQKKLLIAVLFLALALNATAASIADLALNFQTTPGTLQGQWFYGGSYSSNGTNASLTYVPMGDGGYWIDNSACGDGFAYNGTYVDLMPELGKTLLLVPAGDSCAGRRPPTYNLTANWISNFTGNAYFSGWYKQAFASDRGYSITFYVNGSQKAYITNTSINNVTNTTFNISLGGVIPGSNITIKVASTTTNIGTPYMNVSAQIWPTDIGFVPSPPNYVFSTDKVNYSENDLGVSRLFINNTLGLNVTLNASVLLPNGSIFYNVTTVIDAPFSFWLNNTFDVGRINYNYQTLNSSNVNFSYQVNATNLTVGAANYTNTSFALPQVWGMAITNCTPAISTTPAFNMTFQNESDLALLNHTKINITAAVFNVFNPVSNRTYFLSFNTSLAYYNTTCIFPPWANYTVSNLIVYSKKDFDERRYVTRSSLSNTTTLLNLYLSVSSINSEIDITLKDYASNLLAGYIVYAQRYNFANSSYITVEQGVTDYAGRTVMHLDRTAAPFLFVIADTTGAVVATFNTALPSSLLTSTNVYGLTFTLTQDQSGQYQQLGNVYTNCVFTNSTGVLSCTVVDGTQLSRSSNLTVMQSNGTTNMIQVCSSSANSGAATLTCSIPTWNNSYFTYQLILVNSDGSTFIATSGSFDYRQTAITWGNYGFLVTMFFVLGMYAIGSWNMNAGLIMAGVGFLFSFMIGAFNVGLEGLIGVELIIILLIWKSRG